MRTIWAIVGLVALLDAPPPRIERLTQWAEAAIHHRPGDSDSALVQVAAMSIADMQILSIDAQTLVTLMRRPGAMTFFTTSGKGEVQIKYSAADLAALRILARRVTASDIWCAAPSVTCGNDLLKRAALLEGDVAMLATSERAPIVGSRPNASFGFEVKVNDGRTKSVSQAPVHWALARRMLDLITPKPARDPMVHAWYVATIAQLEAAEQHDTGHLERALALFPSDAMILFLNGCLHEVYASDHIQAAVKAMRLPPGLNLGVGSARSERQLAEEFLRKALSADPSAAETRLHLGRVLGLLDHHQEAAVELGRAANELGDPLNEYYAALFLGREEEALGRLDAAHASYERAASLYPDAQSAHLALSQLAWRRADRTRALEAVRAALSRTDDPTSDPWWTYHVAHVRHADALLEELRRPFLEDRRP